MSARSSDQAGKSAATEYLNYIKEDEELYRCVTPVLSDIESLNAQQIEKFIFYLKSLHNYYPASENYVGHFDHFNTHLNKLRTSETQVNLQVKARRLMLLAMVVAGVSVAALLAGLMTLLSGATGWGIVQIVVAFVLFGYAEIKFATTALVTAKEQDRRYFLESLRSARACNELDWAGLFSYNSVTKSGPQSDADIELTKTKISELSEQLRSALYNDEYMEYSLASAVDSSSQAVTTCGKRRQS